MTTAGARRPFTCSFTFAISQTPAGESAQAAAGVIHFSAAPLSSLNYPPPPLFPFNQLPAKLSLLQMLRGGPCPVTQARPNACRRARTRSNLRKSEKRKEEGESCTCVVCCFVFSPQKWPPAAISHYPPLPPLYLLLTLLALDWISLNQIV